jgi:hypothetical protein
MNDNKELAELLRRARRMLNAEFMEKNSRTIPKFECDMTWLSKGIMLPYPPVVKFPTEKEVIAKALELYNQSNPNANNVPLVKTVEDVPETIHAPIVDIESEKHKEIISGIYTALTASPELLPIPEPVEPITESEIEPIDQANDISMRDIEDAESIEDDTQRTTRLRGLLNKFISLATDLESKNKGASENV